jgi:hypothetical protein
MMKDRREEGSWAWRQADNHNHMMELQDGSTAPQAGSSIELAYFAGSAFRPQHHDRSLAQSAMGYLGLVPL